MQNYDGDPEQLLKKFIKAESKNLKMVNLIDRAANFTSSNFTSGGLYRYVRWAPQITLDEQDEIMKAIEIHLKDLCEDFHDAYCLKLIEDWEPSDQQQDELYEYEENSDEYFEALSEMEIEDINWHTSMNPPDQLFKLVITDRFCDWLRWKKKLQEFH